MTINETSCCGLDEIMGVSAQKPNIILKELYEFILDGDSKPPFYLFTDETSSSGGKGLAKYIKDYKLGDLVCTKSKRNPNSGHNIKAWLWTINKNNFSKWYVDRFGHYSADW